MLLPFKLGAGGIIGSGDQYMSWIALDDALGVIKYALFGDAIFGAINTVAPEAVTNKEYTRILGRVLSRPTLFPMPAFAARLAFGEMADALLLSSARVEPAYLIRSKYPFQFPQLEDALRHLLNR
jgi:NAD dependent epimerase/dehydratase family enzyme